MAPGVSLDDRSAWDDSALIDSWDEAVAEYQKYHSISKSGKRLEDVLTREELEQLRGDYGDLMDEETGSRADPNDGDDADAALPQEQTKGEGPKGSTGMHAQVRFDILTGCNCYAERELTRNRIDQHPATKEAQKRQKQSRRMTGIYPRRCRRLFSGQPDDRQPISCLEQSAWHETSNFLTVGDENLKNLMMSWYYAGYYTGLATGQQQAASDNNPLQKQE
ncbi:hypothetical protein N0V90_008234 [Kalmusia sp. IMI 367209]|nr:hypothetical protein N0V90_008234 [Kalmusia sp. IMI 367209]